MSRAMERWRWRVAGAIAFVAVAALAACYLPNNYKAEVRLGKNGDFSLAYYGELVWAPLYRDIQQGKYTSEQIPQQVEMIRKDLVRDTNFKTVESLGQGRFKVAYERQGRLEPSQEVTFVRRNAIIILMRATADGRVTINSAAIKPGDAKTIADMGLALNGEFRIVTDGLVRENNATRVEPYQQIYQLYIWKMEGPFAPPVHFVMQREGAWTPKPNSAQ